MSPRAQKVPTRPRCRYCNRPLAKHTVCITVPEGVKVKVGDSVAHPYAEDRHVTVLQITRRFRGAQIVGQPRTTCYKIWYGAYGRDGLSIFCGPQCGYRYAVDVVRNQS